MIVKMMFVLYSVFISTPGKQEIHHADTSSLGEDVASHWDVKASFASSCMRATSFQNETVKLIVLVLIACLRILRGLLLSNVLDA